MYSTIILSIGLLVKPYLTYAAAVNTLLATFLCSLSLSGKMPRQKKSKKPSKDVKEEGSKPVNVGVAKEKNTSKTNKLTINKKFAERYEDSTRKKLLATVPAALLEDSDDSSSSEEEDEFGELLTKGVDRQVQETLEAIRNRDPRVYDRNSQFFDRSLPSHGNEDEGEKGSNDDVDGSGDESEDVNSDDEPVAGWNTIAKAHSADAPKMTLKDYVRETLLENGRLSDSEEDDEDTGRQSRYERSNHFSGEGNEENGGKPVQETAQKGNLLEDDSGDSDGKDNDDGNFFQKKMKSQEECEAEEKDFEKFLMKQSKKNSRKAGEDLLLHSYLENEKPDEKERFLRDFVLNNGWLDKNASEAPEAGDYEIEIDKVDVNAEKDDNDEAGEKDDDFEEKVDEFEAKYNFRFEDPDGAQVVSHARKIPESMRRPDERRKREREARKLRKHREKAVKTEDLRRLKNLKKKEIQTRLLAIQEAAGDGIDVTGIDLDGDFDPDEFNRQMESKFGEDYYTNKDAEMKQLTKEGVAVASDKRLPSHQSDNTPSDIREDVNKMMDEYYNLEYEDIVGGVPMRFNYKKVEPESFNLTPEDVLSMEDKELNRLVSLKYLAPYRANRDIKKQSWRVHHALRQKRQAEATAAANEAEREYEQPDKEEKRSKKKRKKRRREQEILDEVTASSVQDNVAKEDGAELNPDVPVGRDEGKPNDKRKGKKTVRFDGVNEVTKESDGKKKKKRRKLSKSEAVDSLSAARKEAYSLQ